MSTDFTRNKGKRVRSTSTTEVNNSFVKTVTSRVSGLLPATISKWFSSPSSSSANGSGPPNEATDSSTDDEVAESVTMTQPPMKKMRFSSNASSSTLNNNFELLETTSQPLEASKTTEICNTFSVIQSPPGKTTFRRRRNFVSTPPKAGHDAASSPDDRNEEDKIYFTPQLSVSQIGQSIEKKRKSLFNNSSQASNESTTEACKKSSLNTMRDSKQPSFKASLLGSPFYAGRTMYGGAAASAASSLYINQPNIKQTKVCVVDNSERSSADSTMSHAARRVLDLLEHYSSPLIEAKRIPAYTKPKHDSLTLNVSRDSSIADRSNKVKSYKTQELHVPSIASFLRVKQRSRLMDSTTAARQIMASQSSTSEFIPYPTQAQKNSESERHSLTTKVTSRLTRPRRGDVGEIKTDVAAPIELPTAVLQIDKDDLPKFSFAATIVTNTASVLPKTGTSTDPKIPETLPKQIEAPTVPQMTVIKDNTQEAVNARSAFKFSSPIRITKEQHQFNSTESNFVFGSPDRSVGKGNSVSSVVGGLAETSKTVTTPTNKSNDWKCGDCWVNNKPEAEKCVCCGGQKPAQGAATSKKCSLCKITNAQVDSERCIGCKKEKTKETTAMKLPVTAPANKWTCQDCWVKNDDSVDKCVCCGSQNTKLKAVTSKATTQTSSDKPWRCADCWISNDSLAKQCAACGASPPASAPTSAPAPAPATTTAAFKPASDSLLTNIVKSQSEKWECPSCLFKNENHVMKCACCETPKPGSGTDSQKKFNFGVSNTTFKFGIPAANQSSTAIGDSNEAATGEKGKPESEKNNNNLPSTPVLTFGMPTPKTDNITLPTSTPNPVTSFKFGLPSAMSGAPPSTEKPSLDGFKFTAPAKDTPKDTTVVKEKELEQEVPKVKEQPSSAATPAAFEYFASGTNHLNKNSVGENPLLTGFTTLNKKASDSTITDKSTSFEVPKNNFTFSSVSGNENSITAATASSNTTTITVTPVKPAAPAASAPLSTKTLFTNNDPPNANVGFPKTEISPPSTTTSTAVFGFGSNITSESKSDVKPKFNLSFGGLKPDAAQSLSVSFSLGGSAPAAAAALMSNAASPANGSAVNANDSAKSSVFGSVQKENVWPSPALNNNSANMFASSIPSTNNLQKPPAFSFGNSTSFPSGNVNQTPAFGSNSANNTIPAFGGSTTTTPTFGNNQQGANATATFGSNPQVPNTLPAFGANQQTTSMIPSFGSNQNAGLTPAFGQQTSGLASTFSNNQQPSLTASPFGNSQQNTITSSTFGAGQQSSSTPFGGSLQRGAGGAPAFGAGAQAGVNSTPTPIFGGSTTTNMFGMSSSNGSSQPSLFSNPVQNQAASMFGSPQGGHGAQGAGMAMFGTGGAPAPAFGSAPAPAAPAFGTSTPMPTFDAPAMAPVPTPAFNFGNPQNNAMFGFRQQQPAGVYNFGSAPGTSPQVQFNMGISTGSAPAPQSLANRKIRKAARRTSQR